MIFRLHEALRRRCVTMIGTLSLSDEAIFSEGGTSPTQLSCPTRHPQIVRCVRCAQIRLSFYRLITDSFRRLFP
jgi:hypothetical protein